MRTVTIFTRNVNNTDDFNTFQSISEQWWPEDSLPLASIICVTYNHGNYLKDCLDGFLMQKTSFPVEIIVHDDASTDETREILRSYATRYPKLFQLILQDENQLTRNIRPTPIAIAKSIGKYIAFCEGDDFWTSPNKLERQVRLLEQNSDVKLCFHRANVLNIGSPSDNKSTYPDHALEEFYSAEDILRSNLIPTSSVLARREAVASSPFWFSYLRMNDWPRWVLACEFGQAATISDIMSTYRVHQAGLWQGASRDFRLMWTLDFYCVMSIYAPKRLSIVANSEKMRMAVRLQHYIDSYPKALSFDRIANHIVLGRIIRIWKKLINPKIPL